MVTRNILGSWVKQLGEHYNNKECSPLIFQVMEKRKIRLYPTDSLIHHFHARISAVSYLYSKMNCNTKNEYG